MKVLKEIMRNKDIKKYGKSLKKSYYFFRKNGIEIENLYFDLKLAQYLLTQNYEENISHSSLILQGNEIINELKEKNMEYLYHIELNLIPVLVEMEINGIKVDTNFLQEYKKNLEKLINELKQQIYSLSGEEFNINSPQQVSRILFEKFKLPKSKKRKVGYSTSSDVLMNLAITHELPQKILEYRTLFKLKSSYVDALPNLINKETKRLHTSFNQTVTSTGRLSSSEPNLQNIPIQTDIGREIRKAFVAEDGYVFISADYSQIELRVLAHISEDEVLINAFKNNEDIHTRTAIEVFNITKDEVTPLLRRKAKIINFGIIYGMSAYGLSTELKISQEEAKNYIENYFLKYPKVKKYINETLEKVKKNGYVETIFNRRRYIREINSPNKSVRESAERAAINMPIQGSAADIIKLAMIKLYKEIKENSLDAKILLQIHDELLIECKENEVEKVIPVIKKSMENVCKLKVPLKVDITIGENWYDMK
jgi:DNA polymerase-1